MTGRRVHPQVPAVQRRRRTAAARGVAALTVVMVLFFVMAMVAAYTNRNLVFEQRISANSYRATRALEAADAGVEWTMAMLNGGRTTATCGQPTANAAAGLSDFRTRYTTPSTNGPTGDVGFGVPWGSVGANRVYPACIIVGGIPRCVCPALGEAPADIDAPADGIGTAFRITFRLFDDTTPRVGAVQFISRGCANPGNGASACFAQNDNLPAVDSHTAVITTVGLVRALPTQPNAVLAVGTDVALSGGAVLTVASNDPLAPSSVRAGGTVPAPGTGSVVVTGLYARTPDQNNAEVQALYAQGAEGWFRTLFNIDRASFRRLPATVQVDCTAGCTRAAIDAALLMFPRNPIWAEGDVDLDGTAALGTAADPVMLIVNGRLTVSADLQATGFVHADSIRWTAANARWNGAMVSFTTFTATANATLLYDRRALDTIRLNYGSFVRTPGGWNLY